MRRLWLFYKVLLNKVPKYIYELIPPFRQPFRNPNAFTSFTYRAEYFKNSFFPIGINDWNKLHPKISKSTSGSRNGNFLVEFVPVIYGNRKKEILNNVIEMAAQTKMCCCFRLLILQGL